MMTSKELVKKTLNHQDTGKIPVDFSATAVTGMHVTCVAELRDYYTLDNHPVKVWEPYQMLGEIEEDLLDAIGIDVIGLSPPYNMFGVKNENWKPLKTFWGQDVLVAGELNTTIDENGDLLVYPGGDLNVPASGRMPTSGRFFDSINRQPPIVEEDLNPEDNLEEFGLLSDEDIEYYETAIDNLKDSNRAIIGGIAGTAIGDIALVPAPFMKHPKGIRDIQEWYISTIMRKDYMHTVFTKQTEIAIENLKRIFGVIGNNIEALFICGTDFGTQISTFCSNEAYEELYAPYYKKMNKWIHENTEWKTFKHSCGAVETFMESFISSGFDIINPVQCSATGMDPQTLKDKYGDRLTFWGGGVDTQKTLPFGKPEEVREEVLKRCEIFSKNGGFVFDAIHNVQAKTPVENIVAMIDAVKEFNK
ncbi:methyltransferase [bacterium]|nr:methyltransferase [bacterium]